MAPKNPSSVEIAQGRIGGRAVRELAAVAGFIAAISSSRPENFPGRGRADEGDFEVTAVDVGRNRRSRSRKGRQFVAEHRLAVAGDAIEQAAIEMAGERR